MSLNSNAYPTTSISGCTNSFRPVAPEQPLSRDETAYIAARLAVVQAAWEDWVRDASQLGYSSRQDALNNATIIGIASGGGGLRGALFTAGATQVLIRQNTSGKRSSFDGIHFSGFDAGSAGGTFTGISNRGIVHGTATQIAANRVNSTLRATHQAFPPIPNSTDFLNTGVNLRPTFFACYHALPPAYHLIIYIPNAPPVDGSAPATK
ncbi:hypothetical protein M422DRAFT_262668 [Sphaerobolus stellatus SS14]|uniref:Lysophospholipase n=1 Tax=Sphaerobolus stellatus (strain SS14) TaxID=990650 RepID=A0A0C9V0F4_SPHS4|nr:hypothetical protein M422DRAFT_262668 [Sphaerobolus stellatus SS14]